MEMTELANKSSMMICLEVVQGEPDVWSASDSVVGRSRFVVDSKARGGRSGGRLVRIKVLDS